MLDARLKKVIRPNPDMMIPWYLMASFAYYEHDRPFLSDRAFDQLAKDMLDVWDILEHRHKHLITEEDLEAGTLLRRDFPEIVKGAAGVLMKENERKKKR